MNIVKVEYGGYIVWCGSMSYDVEKPGYDYPVACCDSWESAVRWIDENPDGDAVVAKLEAEKAERDRIILIDLLCG